MPLNLASPGIVVREVDLTIGKVGPAINKTGAIVATFPKGPIETPILVGSEQELIANFSTPVVTDKQYENWLTATSYLSYGGVLRVVRSDGDQLKNASVGSAIKVKSDEDYLNLGYDENVVGGVTVFSRNPGSWANGIKVAFIDGRADQILSGISTAGLSVGYGVTQGINSILAGAGTTQVLNGYLKGVITGVGVSFVHVKVLSHVSAGSTETLVDYQPSGVYSFASNGSLGIHTNGYLTSHTVRTYTTQQDWFDQQQITLTNSAISWNTVADRPSTSSYAAVRGSRFDEVHIVVVDDQGAITGNSGTILEKHLNLSKASDAEYSVGSPSYWRKYLFENSKYIFGGSSPTGIVTSAYSSGFDLATDTAWDQKASDGVYYATTGTNTLTLSGGKNYDGASDLTVTGSLAASLSDLSAGYDIFSNTEEYKVDFLIMGSGAYSKETTQALASKLISVAEERKDCIAFISPYRSGLLTETNPGQYVLKSANAITDNVISFYASIPSSSYAIFDSGYKYMYDRFSDTFRYVPLNGDIAGLCARNDISNFPWFSPAGTSRGSILNAVKLAYNPSKTQRDRLYSNRINPVIFSPGAGIILFGDKTGLAKASAFDRINVRRLFIYLENAISAAAKDQLFEFNDETTRSNFIATVEPFLRDIQAKRGIEDYRIICDSTNNTASIIDNNEFVADIFIKPNRVINYVGLTFVATRSGVSFDEVVGNV